jgi:galactonate dehydratase
MEIVDIKTYLVGNPWKNWLFVQVHTDDGIVGTGEGSLGHLSKTVETSIHEMKPFIRGWKFFRPSCWSAASRVRCMPMAAR